MLFTYTEGGIYELQTATFHETAIELQPREVLTGKDLPTAGDTTRWTVAATRTGMAPNESIVLIVKPLEADVETNMTITTNRRLYSVILKSNERTYMPLVAWLYPQDEARAQQEQLAHAQAVDSEAEPLAVDPDKLNFNCAISGSKVPWAPLRVYDDGAKTYLQMNPEMGSAEAPALFACGTYRRNCSRGSRICCRNSLSLDIVGGPAARRDFRTRIYRTLGTSDNVLPTSHLGLYSGLHRFRDNCRLDVDRGSSDKTSLSLAACAKSTALLRLGSSPPHPRPLHHPADHKVPSFAAIHAQPSAEQARADHHCAGTA